MVESIVVEGDAGALFAALAEAQAGFGELKRTRTVKVQTQTGGGYSFDYAPLEEVLAACLPALNKHGLVLIQPLGRTDAGDILLHSVLAHKSGARLVSTVKVPQGQGRDAIKDLGSSITYLRRYAAQTLLGISAEPDDDAGQASGHQTNVVRDGGKPTAPIPKPTTSTGGVVPVNGSPSGSKSGPATPSPSTAAESKSATAGSPSTTAGSPSTANPSGSPAAPAASPAPATTPPSTDDLAKKYPQGGVAWNPQGQAPEFKPANDPSLTSQPTSPPAPTQPTTRASSETPAGGGAVCADCGNPVPSTVVETRRKKYGAVVCIGCSRTRDAKAIQAEGATR